MSMKLEEKQLGAYRLISLIGKGGFAEVWLAEQLNLNRQVAVKVIPEVPQDLADQHYIERFTREAKAVAQLDHSSILPVIDYGNAGGYLYIVTPYVRGGSLQKRLNHESLPRAEALAIFERVLEGVAYAHQHGIVHRDLKPGNILLHSDGRAVIADFGVAKIENDTLTLTQNGMILGSPEYMAPEQLMGYAEYRSDLYSMGIILYQLLTGRVPFTGPTPWEVGIHQLRDAIPLPDTLVPLPLKLFLAKALQKRPEERFANAPEMIQAFQKATGYLTPDELQTRPPQPVAGHTTSSFPTKVVQAKLAHSAEPATRPYAVPAATPNPVSTVVDGGLASVDAAEPASALEKPLEEALPAYLAMLQRTTDTNQPVANTLEAGDSPAKTSLPPVSPAVRQQPNLNIERANSLEGPSDLSEFQPTRPYRPGDLPARPVTAGAAPPLPEVGPTQESLPFRARTIPALPPKKSEALPVPLILGAVLLLLLGIALAVLFVTLNSTSRPSSPTQTARPATNATATAASGGVAAPAPTATVKVTAAPANSPATATPNLAPTTAPVQTTLAASIPASASGPKVALTAANGTAARGTATFTDNRDGTFTVVLEMAGLGEGVHPSHIHQGSCQAEGVIKYPLNDLQAGVDGKASATTSVQADLATLKNGNFYIDVANNYNQVFYVASCGDIKL
jgi:serine/threonine-protein kinase